MTAAGKAPAASDASGLISQRIAELGDWRGETLARMRALFHAADPAIVEEWKWMGTPIWSREGIISTGESYKQYIKLTFAKGASLKDPAGLFNASLEGNMRRAIDIREGETVDATAFKALVREAIALNLAGKAKKAAAKKAAPKKVAPKKVAPKKVAPKKVAPKKVAPKKAAPKKAAAKKAPGKKKPA